jgi:hypothetical protein
MASERIVSPARFAGMLAPGFARDCYEESLS